jgi:broad specificity phosphatase PhoE
MSESELLRKIELLENQLKAIKSTHRPCFPKRIILVRHGESLGNQDEKIYTTLPDWKVPLTPHGHDQSKNAGKSIKTLIEDDPLSIYCSPYLRTKQTLLGIMSELESNPVISAREEPRLTGIYQCNISIISHF